MRTLTKNLLLFALLFVAVLTASAQSRQRIGLTVTPASQYSTVDECNHYSNTLTLNQPSQNKLLADVLREGNNYLVFHRTNDKDNSDVQFARINLINIPGLPTEIGSVDFSTYTVKTGTYSDGSTVQYIELASPWSGQLAVYTKGFYTFTTTGFSYTVPAGVSNAKITATINTANSGTDSEGYFKIGNDVCHVAANTSNSFELSGTYKTGDVITFIGCDASGEVAASPDMVTTGKAVVISIGSSANTITPCLQRWNGNAWGAYTLMASAQQASAGTEVNLSALGSIVDEFTASTALNDHPNSYGYQVTYNSAATEVVDDPNTPVLTATPTTVAIDADNSLSATFNASGTNLLGNVTVTGDANFTVSPTSISAADAMRGNVRVTVTAKSQFTAATTGTITLTSPGARTVAVNVNYNPPAPSAYQIDPSLQLSSFSGTNWQTLNDGPWSSNSQGVYVQKNYFVIRNGSYSSDYIRYTVPAGISNATLTFVVTRYSSDNTSNNYLKVDGTPYQISKTQPSYIHVTGKSSGNVIEFKGCTQTGGNADTPYLTRIDVWYGEYNGN